MPSSGDDEKDKKSPGQGNTSPGLSDYQFFQSGSDSSYNFGLGQNQSQSGVNLNSDLPDWFNELSSASAAKVTESDTLPVVEAVPSTAPEEDVLRSVLPDDGPYWIETHSISDAEIRQVRQERKTVRYLALDLKNDERFRDCRLPADLEEAAARIFSLVDLDFNRLVDFEEMNKVLSLDDLSTSEKGIVRLVLGAAQTVYSSRPRLEGAGDQIDLPALSMEDFRLAFAREYTSIYGAESIQAQAPASLPTGRESSAAPAKARSKPLLFANADFPLTSIKPDAVRLGTIGDAYFASVLCALAETNPRAILRMIRSNLDGSYSICFPGSRQPPFDVMPPRKDELEVYGLTERYGFWYPLLEKSYGIFLAKRTGLQNQFSANKSQVASRAATAIDTGLMSAAGQIVVPDFGADELLERLLHLFKDNLVAIAVTHDDMSRLKGPRPIPARPYPILSVNGERRFIKLNSIYDEVAGLDLDLSAEQFSSLFRLVFFEKLPEAAKGDKKQNSVRPSGNPWKKF
ncbi:MAG: hypothetical protein SFV17_26625 [Candidatus Obscuribacter sp.]|nr:hypothetical protein [Candidatus Obscuribacter sp.]